MQYLGPLFGQPAPEPTRRKDGRWMLAADVPGDVAAAAPFQFGDEAPALGNHEGLVTGGSKRPGDLQRPLFDAAAFEGRQNLDDLHPCSLALFLTATTMA